MSFVAGFFFGLIGSIIAVPILLGFLRFFGLYTTVEEGQCKVFTLFGKVIGVVSNPGLTFLFTRFGLNAFLIRFFGKIYEVDTRLDQVYLRSQPVNSEEGTPMGIGVWYEMVVSEPVDFLFKNTDPDGSLRANVSNATVRSLSNMPLEDLLQNRHAMSRVVRTEVSPKSDEWGYRLGSVYIRKVHFRDTAMIQQIVEKVANRLRQVTAAIRQAGDNQVEVIKSAAEKEAASEFARAATMRPSYVGAVMADISRDPALLDALIEILQIEHLVKGPASLTLIPAGKGQSVMTDLLAAQSRGRDSSRQPAGKSADTGPGEFVPPAEEGDDAPPLPSKKSSSPLELLESMASRYGQGERFEKARSLYESYKKLKQD